MTRGIHASGAFLYCIEDNSQPVCVPCGIAFSERSRRPGDVQLIQFITQGRKLPDNAIIYLCELRRRDDLLGAVIFQQLDELFYSLVVRGELVDVS